jgi:hypothetical protein
MKTSMTMTNRAVPDLIRDPVMGVLAGKLEARRKDCAPVAGKSTLNRLELSRPAPTRYHRIAHEPEAIEQLFVELFLDTCKEPPQEIVLDLDATGPGLDPGSLARPSGTALLPRLLRLLLLSAAVHFCGDRLLAGAAS